MSLVGHRTFQVRDWHPLRSDWSNQLFAVFTDESKTTAVLVFEFKILVHGWWKYSIDKKGISVKCPVVLALEH